MEQRENVSSRVLGWKDLSIELIVGLFFFIALAILAFFTIVLSREQLFKEPIPMVVHFQQVGGLSEGENVRVRGVQVGVVKDVQLRPDGVEVLLSLDEEVPLNEDYSVEISSSSLLGGRYVAIEPGISSEPKDPQEPIFGTPPAELVSEAAKLMQSLQAELDRLKDVMNEEDVVQRLAEIVNNFHQISTDLRSGNGTLGRLIYDEQFYESAVEMIESAKNASVGVDNAAENLTEVVTSIREGEGTLGKLVTDPSLYNDTAAVIAELRNGQGTVGKLLTDDELYTNLKQTSQDLRQIISRVETGESSVGQFLSDDGELYRQLNKVLNSAVDIVEAVRRGEGSLGKLVMDEGLYEDARKTVDEVRNAVEDFREQAPISTFGSLLFGAF